MKNVMKLSKLQQAVLALAVMVVIAVGYAPSTFADEHYNEVVLHRVTQPASSVVSYWTEERMRNAQPMPLPKLSASPTGAQNRSEAIPSGPMVIAYSRRSGDPLTEERIEPADLAEGAAEPLAGTYPFSFTSFQLFPNVTGLYRVFPYRIVGKVFFTVPGQGDFVCSGSVVSAPNNSVVWTAGHCVNTPGVGFHTNFIFAPARHEWVNPFATLAANTLATPVGWSDLGLFEFDHGGAFMNPGPGAGNFLVGQLLGSLGFLANAPREQHWHARGYPAAAPFDGEHHHTCAATWAVNDQPSGDPANPQSIGIGCDMTGGSSGGPWIVDLSGEAGATNLLNGNVSYTYIGVPDQLYGPYFGQGAIALRDFLGGL